MTKQEALNHIKTHANTVFILRDHGDRGTPYIRVINLRGRIHRTGWQETVKDAMNAPTFELQENRCIILGSCSILSDEEITLALL